MPTSLIARGRRPAIALAAAALALSGLAPSALAADLLAVTTPYPSIAVAPGSNPSFDLTVTAPSDGTVDLSVGGTPSGWKATLHGGGFVVTGVSIVGGKAATARLDVDVPADTTTTSATLTVTARKDGSSASLPVKVSVDANVAGDITLTTTSPTLTGPSGSPFNFDLTLTNGSAEDQTVSATATTQATGWDVTTKLAQANAASTVVKAGSSTTITVTATPPDNAPAGTTTINVEVHAGAKTIPGQLAVEITGSYKMTLSTPNDLLSARGSAGSATTQVFEVQNTGTADLTGVKLTATPPQDWTVTFSPETIDRVPAGGEPATVTATITPSNDAVAGDYVISFTANNGAEGATATSTAQLRYTVEASQLWAIVGIGVIVAIFAGLWYVFRVYGRR